MSEKQRHQLLNVAHAYSKIATACDLLRDAGKLLFTELRAGLPIDMRQFAKTTEAAEIERERLLIFLKRMP